MPTTDEQARQVERQGIGMPLTGCVRHIFFEGETTAHTSKFNGKINWVQIDLGKDAEDADHFIDDEERIRVIMARQ